MSKIKDNPELWDDIIEDIDSETEERIESEKERIRNGDFEGSDGPDDFESLDDDIDVSQGHVH